MSSRSIRSVADLAAAGLVTPVEMPALAEVVRRYPVAVPPALAALINSADPADPIRRQFVPSAAELIEAADDLTDP